MAVLLEADYDRRARIRDGTKDRLRIEGAILSACRERDEINDVQIMDGPQMGRACGSDKAGAIAAAASRFDLPADFTEPAAVALAAIGILNGPD
ncbi:hypothetical protein CG716_13645 [Mycolicibacterium sphagni]|uniref:Uncharacterized protein n=1 Tax=Mycolicibacterium sphagni TaxID=1786 RepID=A0A255DHI2_9MYCO|nr:hypothetical protein CG716_13645 [Mycolicibacterium sphagni]